MDMCSIDASMNDSGAMECVERRAQLGAFALCERAIERLAIGGVEPYFASLSIDAKDGLEHRVNGSGEGCRARERGRFEGNAIDGALEPGVQIGMA